jgi:drug/metabolite transporter (DMT)-like permease
LRQRTSAAATPEPRLPKLPLGCAATLGGPCFGRKLRQRRKDHAKMPDTGASGHRASRLWPGGLAALGAAVLFGATMPLAKALLADADPWLLAGLLYLGAGAGLLAVRLIVQATTAYAELSLTARDWPWLAGAILAGGVAAPVLLMFGLSLTPASTASLLLTLEVVFTIFLAVMVFREILPMRIAIGAGAILAGVAVLSWPETLSFSGVLGPLLIGGACFAWALDNNLTRKVSASDPLQIAMIKGLVAGGLNSAIALLRGSDFPMLAPALSAGILGFAGYGLSLVLFVLALRHIGTARTAAYFSTAPFAGAALAVSAFGESGSVTLVLAGLLMAVGVWLQATERHDRLRPNKAPLLP